MTRNALFICIWLLALNSCTNKEEKATEQETPPSEYKATRVVAIGRVEPEVKITQAGSEVNGVIKKLFVQAGDTVKKGQLLIELFHDYEDARLVQSSARKATQAGEIENVQAQLNGAQTKAANLKTRYERLQKIVEAGADTKQNLDNAKTEYDAALRDVERLQAVLQSAESKLGEIAADIQVAQADIERRKIKAPADGVVLTMDLTEGATVVNTKPLFDFAPLAALTVLCEVDELFVNSVKLGQKAIIRTQGMDDKLAEGEVTYLAPYLKKKSLFSDDSGNMEDRRVREARIRLAGNPALLINSRVEAVISLN